MGKRVFAVLNAVAGADTAAALSAQIVQSEAVVFCDRCSSRCGNADQCVASLRTYLYLGRMTDTGPRLDANRQGYVRQIERRIRWSDRAMNARSVGQKAAWAVALTAGAAVSLSQAVVETVEWVPAALGFVVVVAQGADRLLGRSAEGSASMDRMRRGLSRETRLFHGRAGDYDVDEPFDVFVERAEAIIAEYDEASVAQLEAG